MHIDRPRAGSVKRWAPFVFTGASLAVMLALQVLLPEAGNAPKSALFVGRFHPLLVHLPIGLIFVLAISEALSLRGRELFGVAATEIVLWLAALSAVTTYAAGFLLSREGGYAAGLVRNHQRLAAAVVLGTLSMLIAWRLTAQRNTARARWPYRGLLSATALALLPAAHLGGTLTHGSTFLTEYLPDPVTRILGVSTGPTSHMSTNAMMPGKATVFGSLVQPLLERRCTGCHGSKKAKNQLRLDSHAAILKGGKSGAAIVPGNAAKSRLVQRLSVPLDDDRHMPPEGKPQLTREEQQLLRSWIDTGALPAMPLEDAPRPSAIADWVGQHSAGSPAASSMMAPADSASSAELEPLAQPSADSSSEADAGGAAQAPLAWESIVKPIFSTRCARCHGAKKRKGKLRLDDYKSLMRGGEDEPAVTLRQPRSSPLLRRIRLPRGDDDHMPPKDQPQPTQAEIAVLAWWIERGAARDLRIDVGGLSPTTLEKASRAIRGARPAASDSAPASSGSVSPPRTEDSTQNAGK